MRKSFSPERKVSDRSFLFCLEKTLKNLVKKMNAQAKGEEKAPEDIMRYNDDLKKIFSEHKLSPEAHKSFFDALVEWKRTL